MLTENRKYDYSGILTLNRSHVLNPGCTPQDDIVNWLIIKVGERQLSFIYKIVNPVEAEYGKPFVIEMAFLLDDYAKIIVKEGNTYEVLRGEEEIGILTISLFINP